MAKGKEPPRPRTWRIIPRWQGQTVVVVGGGPSVLDQELYLLDKMNVIAVNNAFRLLPNAPIHYAYDRRWYKWNRDVFEQFKGKLVTAMPYAWPEAPKDRMWHVQRGDLKDVFDPRPTHVAGRDSGTMALNLAVHLGASKIILVGFDMGFPKGQAHWHPDHPVQSKEDMYRQVYLSQYPKIKVELDKRGISVINASLVSNIRCWPKMSLREALAAT